MKELEIYHQALHLQCPNIELLLCRRDIFKDWNFDKSITSMPYFRLYKAYNQNANCIFEDVEKVPLHENEIHLISPDTRFTAIADGIVDKFYILFVVKGKYGYLKNSHFVIKNNTHLLELCDRISSKLLNDDNKSDELALECTALCALTLTAISPSIPINQKSSPPDSLLEVFHRISLQPTRAFSNIELAKIARMSRSVFCRKFNEYFGLSPQQFIIEKRLQKAVIMLRHTNLSIPEISDQCGFCDRYYFTRIFKKNRHITPCEFRKKGMRWNMQGFL